MSFTVFSNILAFCHYVHSASKNVMFSFISYLFLDLLLLCMLLLQPLVCLVFMFVTLLAKQSCDAGYCLAALCCFNAGMLIILHTDKLYFGHSVTVPC